MPLLMVLVTACGLISGLGTAAASTTPQPTSVDAGPGCPATTLVWTPHVTAVPPGDPAAVAPGNLSADARTAFGKAVARLLAGHPGPFRWLGSTDCQQMPASSAPAGRADRAAPPAGALRTAGHPAVAPHSVSPPRYFANWSGYESDDVSFTSAAMEWKVPGPASSAPDDAAVTIWPGIGSGHGTDDELIQAGTETHRTAFGYEIYAWTEIVPDERFESKVSGFPVSAGDDMAVNVTWDPSTGNAAFFLVDYTAGELTEMTRHVKGSSGHQAEWIVERSLQCAATCVYAPISNFGAENIMNGNADKTVNGITTNKYIGGFSFYYPIDMVACSGQTDGSDQPLLAAPTTDVDSQGNFTDYWQDWGHADPEGCTWKVSPGSSAFQATISSGGTVELIDTTANRTLTCLDGKMSGTTGPASQFAGAARIANITGGDLTGCTDPTGNAWSANQTGGTTWQLNGDVGDTSGQTISDITGIAADVTGANPSGSCSFHVSGSVAKGDAIYQDPGVLKINRADLTISRVTGGGCAAAKIANNDTAQLVGSYQFPDVTVDP